MNNNLKQIIYRLDFDISKNEEVLYNDEFLNIIMKSYKKVEIDEIENVSTLKIDKDNPNVLSNNEQIISKVFTNAEGTSQLKINKNCIVFNSIVFNDDLKIAFKDIVDTFNKFNSNKPVTRIGLRKIFVYDNYKSSQLKQPLKTIMKEDDLSDKIKLSRAIVREEYINDDIRITLNEGLLNPTYPSAIDDRSLIIDIDAVHYGIVNNTTDIKAIFDKSEESINFIKAKNIDEGQLDE